MVNGALTTMAYRSALQWLFQEDLPAKVGATKS